ncbi:MAG: hypothetical protein ACRD8A_12575 [Candidatus Acidiferrales bacterium]
MQFRKAASAAIIVLCLAVSAYGQTAAPTNAPTPTQTSMNFNVGSSVFGLGGASNAQPAADVVLQFNPGIPGKLSGLSLISDSLLDPAGDFQYFGGGVLVPLPNKAWSKTGIAPLSFYVRATVGEDRLVPPSGQASGHIAFMAGGGACWKLSSGIQFNIIEVDALHAPGAPWGNNAPAVSGGISYFFGSH